MLNEIVQHGGRVIIQGITGGYARSQAARMLAYGTPVVAGVTPGRGGENLAGVPIFNTVQAAVDATGATVSVLYVPAPGVLEAAWEAMDAGIRLLVIPSEGVPVHDAMKLRALARQRGCWIVGPNTAGIIWPGRLLLGSLAPDDAVPGPVALISRSGTLSFEMVRLLSRAGLGQSFCVSVGGDRVVGRNPAEYLQVAADDPGTRAIVLIGEIGGTKEYEAAEVVQSLRGKKPVVAYVAGQSVPRGRTMGHVGAIFETDRDTAEHKRAALAAAGAVVVNTPWEVPDALRAWATGDRAEVK